MSEINKVGILGGTFDPIHLAHLILAEIAYEQFSLDKVLIMPVGQPPHKREKNILDSQKRIDMINLAIHDNPHLELSRIEVDRDGLTYTAKTLEILKSQNPNTEYYFIIGADSLFYIDEWVEAQKIFNISNILSANRNNRDEYEIDSRINELTNRFNARIYKLDTPNIDISSEDIRRKSKEGKSIRYLVKDSINDYIHDNHLYK